jgi:hypothetical protein
MKERTSTERVRAAHRLGAGEGLRDRFGNIANVHRLQSRGTGAKQRQHRQHPRQVREQVEESVTGAEDDARPEEPRSDTMRREISNPAVAP